MVIPDLYDVPKVVAESGLTEEAVLNLGLYSDNSDGVVFMVVVPELGACRVPDVALSHFMAGADEYAADAMPEHWSKQPSGPWTIKRDRLRVLADSWEKYLILRDGIRARIQAYLEPEQDTATPAPVVAASDGTALKNKSETTLIFQAKVIELMGKFWNERTPGAEPTKGDLSKLVYLEILRTGTRGKRKTTQGMVNDAAKPWKFPLVLPTFVRESQFNEKRHPFKGDR